MSYQNENQLVNLAPTPELSLTLHRPMECPRNKKPLYEMEYPQPPNFIESKIIFLGCVIGGRSRTKRLPPSGPAKNIILDSIAYMGSLNT
jgi:hypothetical protein